MRPYIHALLPLLLFYSGGMSAQKNIPAFKDVTEPDSYLPPLPPASPMARTPEPTFVVRRTHRLSNQRGIDVSHYQGKINWRNVSFDEHASYVYIKATENASLVDDMYYTNLREARAAGIPVGTYHFFSPSASPMTQLLNLTRAMPDLREQDLVPMVDVEVRGKCSIEEFRERLRQFLLGIEERYGVKPIIYTGTNFYNKYLCGYFTEYLYMIARYGDELPDLNGNPKIAIWQYSSKGQIAGIRGNVDLSRFVDNYSLRDILIKKR